MVSFLLCCYPFSVLLLTSDRGRPSVHFTHPCHFASSSVDLPRPYHSAGEGSCSSLTDSPPGTERWDFFKAPKWSQRVARVGNHWSQKALGLHCHTYKHCFNLRAPVLSQLIIGVLEDRSEMAAFIFRKGSTKFGGRGNNSHNQILDSTALVCHSRRPYVLCIRTIQYETGGDGLTFYFLEFFFYFGGEKNHGVLLVTRTDVGVNVCPSHLLKSEAIQCDHTLGTYQKLLKPTSTLLQTSEII